MSHRRSSRDGSSARRNKTKTDGPLADDGDTNDSRCEGTAHLAIDVEAAMMKSLVKSVVVASSIIGAASFAPQHQIQGRTTCLSETATAPSAESTIETDPKEAVKLFGRLAEKYISESHRARCPPGASVIRPSLVSTSVGFSITT